MEKMQKIERLRSIVREIGLTPQNVMDFEECEIVSDLMDEGAIASVRDEELKDVLGKMRRIHESVRRNNFPVYEKMAMEKYSKIGKREWIFKYHEAEGLASSLGEGELAKLGETDLMETLRKLRHVHDDIASKKARILVNMDLH